MRTRSYAVLFALVLLVAGSGCTVQDRYEATPATFGESALSEAGYGPAGEERFVQRNASDRNITVVSHLRTYESNATVGPAGSVPAGTAVTFATPSIRLAGSEFNPVADQSPAELLERFGDRLTDSGRVENVSKTGERETEVLGRETTITRFRASVVADQGSIPITVAVTRVVHEGDFVVVAVAYPSRLGSEGESATSTLFDGLEHES